METVFGLNPPPALIDTPITDQREREREKLGERLVKRLGRAECSVKAG